MEKLIDALNAIARKHNIAASAIVDAAIACLARLRASIPAPVEDTTTPVVPAEPASDAPTENQPDVDATAPAEIPVPVEDTPAEPVAIDYTPFINEMTPFLKAVFCFDATQSISGAADAFDTIKAFAATAPLANDDRVQKALQLLQTSLGEMTAA